MVITEEFVCVIFEIVSLGIFLRRFTVSSYQRALYWQRINDGYFTMSDGIKWYLPYSSQNLSIELF